MLTFNGHLHDEANKWEVSVLQIKLSLQVLSSTHGPSL